jgi:hypothetical protein
MAYFQVRNSLNLGKVIVCGITYKQVVSKGNEGEAIWVIEVATDEPHITTSGTIPPYYINATEGMDINFEIEKAVAHISQQVNWEPLGKDTRAPYVTWMQPADYIQKIRDDVFVGIEDQHPSQGIDKNSIKMIVNGVDVTNDILIAGDEYAYNIRWSPPARIYAQLEE